MDLQTLWFVLIAVLFTGFFVLEGFDYGVGMLLQANSALSLRASHLHSTGWRETTGRLEFGFRFHAAQRTGIQLPAARKRTTTRPAAARRTHPEPGGRRLEGPAGRVVGGRSAAMPC